MKTLLSILSAGMILSCAQPQQNERPAFDETRETEAIQAVIRSETDNFYAGNYEGWKKTWSHSPYAYQAWNLDDGTVGVASGWEKIDRQGKGWIESIYKNGENVIHPSVKKEKPEVHFFNDSLAYLAWKQYNADKTEKLYYVSHETRLMQKEADGWKILNVSAFWDSKNAVPADSLKGLP